VKGAKQDEAAAPRTSQVASTVSTNLLRKLLWPSGNEMLLELKVKSDQVLETLSTDKVKFYNEHTEHCL